MRILIDPTSLNPNNNPKRTKTFTERLKRGRHEHPHHPHSPAQFCGTCGVCGHFSGCARPSVFAQIRAPQQLEAAGAQQQPVRSGRFAGRSVGVWPRRQDGQLPGLAGCQRGQPVFLDAAGPVNAAPSATPVIVAARAEHVPGLEALIFDHGANIWNYLPEDGIRAH
ncbi:MAG: hypothetical protein EBX98_02590, partial [Burkholderiaceae bacterium]|nr:hypothetical protein [Burkholderiaceae bacterium]